MSAENLSQTETRGAAWFSEVAHAYDTEVVIYLRRQDELLLSAWRQWYAKIYSDFWGWLVTQVGLLGDWRSVLNQWENVVGRDSMRVRLYERRRLISEDVVRDFSQYLVESAVTLDLKPDGIINPSFSDAVVDLLPGAGLFSDIHDSGFYEFLTEMVGDACYKRDGEAPITFDQRAGILERYAESNAWVRENYFAEEDMPKTLFEPPSSAKARMVTADELRREQVQLIMRDSVELSRRTHQ